MEIYFILGVQRAIMGLRADQQFGRITVVSLYKMCCAVAKVGSGIMNYLNNPFCPSIFSKLLTMGRCSFIRK